MRTYRDSKAMAKTLSTELRRRNIELSHGECLDIVARQFGLDNWNVLSARVNAAPTDSRSQMLDLPAGWFVTGSGAHFYDVGLDTTMSYQSGHPAMIRCRDGLASQVAEKDLGFGTLMQSIRADAFRGHRVKLRADLRTRNVAVSAAIWFRVDGDRKNMLAFDNLDQRRINGPLSGTLDWTERSIVLAVPEEAASLHFGFLLRGSGAVWAGGFDLTIADHEAVSPPGYAFLAQPTNLDFSDRRQPAA